MTQTYWDNLWTIALNDSVVGPEADDWGNTIDRRKMSFIRRYAPATGTAIEVGCGSARLLARLGRTVPGLSLVAIDESEMALELAQRTASAFGVNILTKKGSVEVIPLESNSVDFVASGGLLEHFVDPGPVIAEMLRVLKPGGTLYADVVPRKMSWYRRPEANRMRTSHWLAPGVYESSLGPEDYRGILKSYGCTKIVTKWCGVYPWRIQTWWGRRRNLASAACAVMDGSPIAARWGWYFMLSARKEN